MSFDTVEFPVKVLNCRCVVLVKSFVEEPRDNCGFPNFSGAQNHHPVAVLGRYVELVVGRGRFLNHSCC